MVKGYCQLDKIEVWFNDFLCSLSDKDREKVMKYLELRDNQVMEEFMVNNIDALYKQAAIDLMEEAKNRSIKLQNQKETIKYLS